MSRWKEASSLIISTACKSNIGQKSLKFPDKEKYNFDLLTLKKKETLPSGNPQVCVFPGGRVSAADSVKEWEGLFSEFGMNINALSNSLVNNNISRLPIFNKSKEGIPRWLSLRITAIRETFEECGLLLCKNVKPDVSGTAETTFTKNSSHLAIDEIEPWRELVLEDPNKFFTLCEHYRCYPDVENLVLWSNWLTPSHMDERFDAVFFFTDLSNINLPKVSPDNREISSTEWLAPSAILELSSKEEIFLKPPQWYEINLLKSIQTSGGLQQMISHKSSNCHLWMPVRILASDGEVSLLPGDDMYPNEVDPFFPSPVLKKEHTVSTLRCMKMHRMEHKGARTALVDTRSLS